MIVLMVAVRLQTRPGRKKNKTKKKNKKKKKKVKKEFPTFEVFGEAGIVASMRSFMEDFSVSFGFEYSYI